MQQGRGACLSAEFQRLYRVGAAAARFVVEDFTRHTQNVAAALLGRNVFLHPVGIKNQADLVAVPDRGKGQNTGQFGDMLGAIRDPLSFAL